MTTNINNAPWNDDFSTDKDFHQILFKPGFPVQARELTQLQSILRDQVAKFGSHVFKHGSVVIPGNCNSELNVCYVKLQPTIINIAALENKTVIGATTGLRGIVRKGIAAVSGDPDTLYVSYYNSGTSGERLFLDGEVLDVEGISLTVAASAATGGASMAFISDGVFFVNGSFVSVRKQSVVIGKYTNSPSCHVLLQIKESVVTSDMDSTLLDPAQGSYNYAAPGADRLKIELIMTTLSLSDSIDDNYIELMRYNDGVLEEHLRYPKYNELEKSFARRTYDESGDYVVDGLNVSVREHKKSTVNGGKFVDGDVSKFITTTSTGKAYVLGFEQELISPRDIVVDKARGADHLNTTVANLIPSYGQTMYVTNITGLPSFLQKTSVNLYNSTATATLIGTARVLSLDYHTPNTTDSNAIFKLCLTDVKIIDANYDISNIGLITEGLITDSTNKFTVLSLLKIVATNAIAFGLGDIVQYASSPSRLATVHKYTRDSGELFVYKHSSANLVPLVGDNITVVATGAAARVNSVQIFDKGTYDNLLVQLPTDSTYRVKNQLNVTDMAYKIYHEATVSTNGSGAGSFSVSGMTIDPKEYGNFIISSSNGTLLPLSVVTVAPDGLSVTIAGATVSATLKIICTATKTGANAAPKTKTLVSGGSDAALTPSALVQLTRADIIRVTSITSTIDGNVTDRYALDNGQRDYAYLRGSLVLKTGFSAPAGTLTVVYDYFNHNAGSGDYFSVDSYESSGIANYYESPILVYTSKNSGNTYDLRDVLDFRSKVNDSGTYVGGTVSLSRVVQNDSRLTTSIRKYIGRFDAVVLNKSNNISLIAGTPADVPLLPNVPNDVLFLAKIYVPPYTFSVADVKVKRINNRVYTMKDVGNIASRLLSLEEYVLLNESENFAINYEVVDATTGLNRYKSGYLVDTFKNPDIIGDNMNPRFKVTYVSEQIIPQFEVIEAPLFVTNSTAQISNGVITLPYTETTMASQPVSSKITNINPFAVFSWTGKLVIFPEADLWSEIEYLPTVINNITETTTEYVTITRPYTGTMPTQLWNTSGSLTGAINVVQSTPISVSSFMVNAGDSGS